MSASDTCKEALVQYYDNIGISTSEKEWKRIAKIKHPPSMSSGFLRTFVNNKRSLTAFVWAYTDDVDAEEMDIWEGGGLYYTKYSDAGATSFTFASKTAFDREQLVCDQECGHIIELAYNIPSWILEDEATENTFMVDAARVGQAEAILKALGAEPGPKSMQP